MSHHHHHPFPEAEMRELRARFDTYDKDKSGSVDADELIQLLQSAGEQATEAKVKEVMAEVDTDKSGKIEFNEYVRIVHRIRTGDAAGSSAFARVYSKERNTADTQKKTFTAWTNAHLHAAGKSVFVKDLFTDLKDGVILCQLVEALSGKPLKHSKTAKIEIQWRENLVSALKRLADDGVRLVNIGASDILEGTPTTILGMVWTMILHYEMRGLGDAAGQAGGAKAALLRWVKSIVDQPPYASLLRSPQNFNVDFADGKVLAALVHALTGADRFDAGGIEKNSAPDNIESAFAHAKEALGVERLLDPADLLSGRPDENSVMTYVSFLKSAAEKAKGAAAAAAPPSVDTGAAERAAAEAARLEAERLAAEKALAERAVAEAAAAEAARLEAERLEAERLAAEQAAEMARREADRLAAEKLAAELAAAEAAQREAERIAAEKAAADAARIEAEAARIEAERLAAEKAAAEAEAARLEAERLAAEEAARLEAERLAAEEKARQEAEAARLAAEAEAARLAAEAEAARLAAEAEAARLAAEAEAARLAVVDKSTIEAGGDGLVSCVCGGESAFIITPRNAGGNVVSVPTDAIVVAFEHSHPIAVALVADADGRIRGTYTAPPAAGHAKLAIRYKSPAAAEAEDIPGSPFTVTVHPAPVDAASCSVDGDRVSAIGQETTLRLSLRDRFGNAVPFSAAPLTCELLHNASLSDPQSPLKPHLSLAEPHDHHHHHPHPHPHQHPHGEPGVAQPLQVEADGTIRFTPQSAGSFAVTVNIGGAPVTGTPFVVSVRPGPPVATNTEATGGGVVSVTCGRRGEFVVVARDAAGNITALEEGDIVGSFDGDESAVQFSKTALFVSPQLATSSFSGGAVGAAAAAAAAAASVGGAPSAVTSTGTNPASAAVTSSGNVSAMTPSTTSGIVAAIAAPAGSLSGYYTAPSAVGKGTVALRLKRTGDHIVGSPFTVDFTAGESSHQHSLLEGPAAGVVGQEHVFRISLFDHCKNALPFDASSVVVEAVERSTGAWVPVDTTAGDGTVKFAASLVGNYALTARVGQTHISNSPIELVVTAADADASKTTAEGLGLLQAAAGVEAAFVVTMRDAYGNTVSKSQRGAAVAVSVHAADGTVIAGSSVDNGTGAIACAYTPMRAGPATVHVLLDGQPIKHSPFELLVGAGAVDASRCVAEGSGLEGGVVGLPDGFVVQAYDAVGNKITSGGAPITFQVIHPNPQHQHQHQHHHHHHAGEAAPSVDNGDGTSSSSSSSSSGAAAAAAAAAAAPIVGEVHVATDNGDGSYTCSYTPLAAGKALIHVRLGETDIATSPREVTIQTVAELAKENEARRKAMAEMRHQCCDSCKSCFTQIVEKFMQ